MMKKNITRILLIISLFFSVIPSVFAENGILQLKNSIKLFSPFKCKFEQQYFDAFQEKTFIATGTLSFMQPGLMKWVYEQPEEMVFIIGRETLWLYDPVLENVTIQQLNEVSEIRSLRFLSGEEDISIHFREINPKINHIDQRKGLTAIYLAPKENKQALSELQVLYDQKTNQIYQFVIINHNSNYRKITLNQISIQADMRETEFVFNITENMEIIQGINN